MPQRFARWCRDCLGPARLRAGDTARFSLFYPKEGGCQAAGTVRAQEPKDRELGGGQGERLFVKGALVGILIEHQAVREINMDLCGQKAEKFFLFWIKWRITLPY